MSAPAISLLSQRPPLSVPDERVYFSFASGRFTYDCVTCGAQCCRGHGYVTSAGPELQRQLARRPHLRFFLQAPEHGQQVLAVRNCPPACFFLTEPGLCGIHAEEGPDAKPETCRLFPFNRLRMLEQYLVVMPHRGLCPLGVVPPTAADDTSSYEALRGAMRARGISAFVPAFETPHADVDAVIALERTIVGLSTQPLSYPAFVALQLQATAGSGLCGPAASIDWPHAPETVADVIDGFLRHCAAVLGLPHPISATPQEDVDWTMVALTPYLRTGLVFRDTVDASEPPPPVTPLERVPYVLLASYVMTLLARLAGVHAITFQTVTRLQQNSADLVWLLSDVDRPMQWAPDAGVELSSGRPCYTGPFIKIAKALLSGPRGSHRSLGEILAEENPFTGIERVSFLRVLAGRLLGRVEPVPVGERRVRPRRTSLRPRLQQWSLRTLSERTLRLASNRRLAERVLSRS